MPTMFASAASRSTMDHLQAWMNTTAPLFEPKSPMGAALRYLNNQWSRLRVFLDDPLVPIHNNRLGGGVENCRFDEEEFALLWLI